MNNFVLGAHYAVLALATVVVTALVLARGRRSRMVREVVFLAGMILGWQLTRIVFNMVQDPDAILFLYDIDLPFVAFTSVALLVYVLQYFGLRKFCSWPVILLLCVIPAFTTGLALFPGAHMLLRESVEILSIDPTIVRSQAGIWFYVHAAYCYFLFILSISITLGRMNRLPAIHRKPVALLVAGILISLSGNLLIITRIFDVRLDFSLVSGTVCLVFVYLSARDTQGLDFYNKARNDIFNELDTGIFVLDDERSIVDCNGAAQAMLRGQGFPPAQKSYQDFYDILTRNAQRIEPGDDETVGLDIYLLHDGQDIVYNARERVIKNRRERVIGTFALWEDVTENRMILRRLEADAGLDAMTGLLNRRRMDELILELDTRESLPLAVIMGDLNYLKRVNDMLGHQQGDVYLRLAAAMLSANSPPVASIGRVGGDEFQILIPRFTAGQAEELLQSMREDMERNEGRSLKVSMALGYAVKEDAKEDIWQVAAKADGRMYANKREMQGERK